MLMFVWGRYVKVDLGFDIPEVSFEMAGLAVLVFVVCLIVRVIGGDPHDENNNRYNRLASQLSQVAGKSEVVINAITDGVLALDSQGVIELINPSAQKIIGWGKKDALSLNYKSVLKIVNDKNEEMKNLSDPIQKALSENKPVTDNNLFLVTNSGKNISVSLVISPVGQPGSGVIVAFRDITKEKAEERQQAEFISTASHEMRTPVASIEGYLGLALNPSTATIDAKAREFITKAHESSQHLGRLFQDLLDVSKADDGRMRSNPSIVDLVSFIGSVVEDLKPKADQKNLRLVFRPAISSDTETSARRMDPVYYVNVDNDHLREIMSNLIENAIKYTHSGDVTIDIDGTYTHAKVSIADTGIGIPPEDIPHLFQKFYRVDNSDTREIGGTGLGLYLCRRLVETMNGRLWVESEYKKGSTFFVELPRVNHEEAQALIEQASIEAEKTAQNAQHLENATAQVVAEESSTYQDPSTQMISTGNQAVPAAYTQPAPSPSPTPAQTPPQPPQAAAAPPTPAPTPIPAPEPTTPVAPTPANPTASYPNVPLSQIESNPANYTQPRDSGLYVPPRH